MSFRLADLEPGHLGGASGTTVLIDRDAAGWGWYVDPTPADDAEFAACSGDLRAGEGSAAEGRMDLLTVVMHELPRVAKQITFSISMGLPEIGVRTR